MRYENGAVALWPRHLARLMEGATRLSIDQAEAQIESEMQFFVQRLLAEGSEQGVIKLRLIRGGDRRGYTPEPSAEHWRIFEYSDELPEWGKPETAIICSQRLASQPQLAGIKHLNRLEQVLAAKEVSTSDASTGIMLDQRGMLGCGIDSNLFVEMRSTETKSEVLTPSLTHSGVRGVLRSYAIDRLKHMNFSIVEQDIDPSLLGQCSGLWLGNAVRGLRPVESLSGVGEWTAESVIMKSLQSDLRRSLRVT